MSRNRKQPQAPEQIQKDAPAGTVEAIEPQDQTTVEVVVDDEPAEELQASEQTAGTYAVQWGIKLDGKRYGTGDDVTMTSEQAAPFIASGAIKAKE